MVIINIFKRLLTSIMWLTYIILIVFQFLWCFIPLIFGYNHEQIIDKYFNYITDYSDGLFND